MARDFCSCSWCRGHDIDHHHHHGHGHRFRDPWALGNMRAHPWAFPDFASGSCCDLCKVSSNIPGLREGLVELGHILPPIVQAVIQALHNIHHHYQLGLHSDNEDSYFLAREIETLSRHVRKLYRAFPERAELALWADQLKYMGREVQAEPRRFRHNLMVRHRNNRRLLPPQIAW